MYMVEILVGGSWRETHKIFDGKFVYGNNQICENNPVLAAQIRFPSLRDGGQWRVKKLKPI